MSDEKEDLDNLVKSPGWLRVQAFAEQEWTEQIGRHMESAVDDRDDLMALQKLRQVIAAKKAVQRLLAWPEERRQKLATLAEAQHAMPALSRRGGL